jgi:hypothetical protein
MVAPRLGPPGRPAEPGAERLPAIFVIGCQRSGTSLLRRILDSHSRIACPPESKFIAPLAQLLRDGTALKGLESMGYDREQVSAALGRFIAEFFERYAAAQGKSRWADKTPNYVDHLAELREMFGPSARFLLIVRHGMDVAHSLADPHRRYPAIEDHVARAGGNVPVGAAAFWAEQSEKIERFRLANQEACLQVRYEDVTERPEPSLEAVFRFLGEQWEPEVMHYGRFVHHAGFEDPDVAKRREIEPNSGRYLEWPADVREAARKVCEPMLLRLGYS